MRLQIVTFYLASAITLLACSDKKKQDDGFKKKLKNDNAYVNVIEFPLKKFSLPYDSSFNCDSNSLIYLHQAPFDTSYIVHIRKLGQNIKGVCYIMPQSYHRSFEDFSDKEHELLFFTGLSFKLDSSQWQILKRETIEAISKMTDSIKTNSPCFDCHTYAVIFNNMRRVTGNGKLSEIFKEYDTFIRDNVINYFLNLKKIK